MPRVSIMILTKDRADFLKAALLSVREQTFSDYEIVLVNDGSKDNTVQVLHEFQDGKLQIITHEKSVGIIQSRQEALLESRGEYVAILDDDDKWIDSDKLKKQVEFLDKHPEYALVGGGIRVIERLNDLKIEKLRPQDDKQIRRTMLFRNNFFTSTVMFRREITIKAGGFIKNGEDLAEDYDLWLRLGKAGKMHNFSEVFTLYTQPDYNKEKRLKFLQKQLKLAKDYKNGYSHFLLAKLFLRLRILFYE